MTDPRTNESCGFGFVTRALFITCICSPPSPLEPLIFCWVPSPLQLKLLLVPHAFSSSLRLGMLCCGAMLWCMLQRVACMVAVHGHSALVVGVEGLPPDLDRRAGGDEPPQQRHSRQENQHLRGHPNPPTPSPPLASTACQCLLSCFTVRSARLREAASRLFLNKKVHFDILK